MLTGYLSQLGCRAGDSVEIMLGGSPATATVDLIRLIHGDTNPKGPGFVFEEIPEVAPRKVAIREVATPIGSFARSKQSFEIATGDGLEITFEIWPTVPAYGRRQAIFALPGLALAVSLDETGILELAHAGQMLLRGRTALLKRTWYSVSIRIDGKSASALVDRLEKAGTRKVLHERLTGPGAVLTGETNVVLAASGYRTQGEQLFAADLYNGKIACPALKAGGRTIGAWRFQEQMDSQVAIDGAGNNHLSLINVPTRAMTGPRWTGEVHAWTEAPDQYDAIHFHDDDLADAKWPVSLTIRIPETLPSGVYAVRIRTGTEEDHIPLAVRPAPSAPAAKVALILSTYTYLAYANEHLTEGDFEQGSELEVTRGLAEAMAAEHQEWGKSVYDYHSDGSGVAHSTFLRPIPNMRPTYRFWGFDAPRRFSCDLYIVHFLHQQGIPFDILTEHDLHAEWQTILAPYQTVISGTHPEYTSGSMLDALENHVDAGGGLLYLGGDGFYWVTTPVRDLPAVIEVRKFEGLRHWEAEPGERYQAGTGELGGIWRSRGRSAHKLFGVGMTGYGWDNKAPGYRRSAASYRPEAAWVFEGIEDEVVGDFGLIMNGTSGDEIDCVDERHGTPPETIVLASSEPHSQWYVPVPEDIHSTSNKLNATFNPKVRSDMVLVEKPNGGAVFAVGSIIFAGALPINGGQNNVATLLANVVRNFTARTKANA